jgi:hypothetical protein
MRAIPRPRTLLRPAARLVIAVAVFAGADYLFLLPGGPHPGFWAAAGAGAGAFVLADVVRRATRGRGRTGATAPTGHDAEAPGERSPGAVAPEVLTLVARDQKIQAIKLYRELNPGTGLKEAKDVIDGL